MVRKQIYLEKRQVKAIQQKAEALGVSVSELIRQAIDHELFGAEGILNRPGPGAWQEIEAFITSQAAKPLAGQPYHSDREELYDERLSNFQGTDAKNKIPKPIEKDL